jgi:hypothetical protein
VVGQIHVIKDDDLIAKNLTFSTEGKIDWNTDKENGDYTKVTFSKLILNPAEAPIQ